jgi:cytochrome b561
MTAPAPNNRADNVNTTSPPAAAGYGPAAKLFHWLTVALLATQFTLAWTMPEIHRGTLPVGLIAWHLSVGAAIAALVLVRLGWRVAHPVPPGDAPGSLSYRVAAATHILLYLLMIVVVVLGWVNASSRGWTVTLLGMVPLPAIAPSGWRPGHIVGDIHGYLAIGTLVLAGLHVLGALYHHFMLRDSVLQRMLLKK